MRPREVQPAAKPPSQALACSSTARARCLGTSFPVSYRTASCPQAGALPRVQPRSRDLVALATSLEVPSPESCRFALSRQPSASLASQAFLKAPAAFDG